jgi:hypothetical protein
MVCHSSQGGDLHPRKEQVMGVGDERAGSLTTQRAVLVIALALFAGLLSIFVYWKPASGAANVPPRSSENLIQEKFAEFPFPGSRLNSA